MILIFIRHGDPRRDSYSLTEKGLTQSRMLGNYFSNKTISKIFSAPSTRARETTTSFLEALGDTSKKVKVDYVEWLNEFKHPIQLPNGNTQFAWEIPLDLWCMNHNMLNLSTCMDQSLYASGNIKKYATEVWNSFDMLMHDVGYDRVGGRYDVIKGNKDTYLFITHFATISVLLSHILNIPLPVMLHFFWQAPSGFTTLRSEEMEQGKAIFRCVAYNETTHLLSSTNEDVMSFYGLKRECYNHTEVL